MTGDSISVYAPVAGVYSLRVSYTPYWRVDDPTRGLRRARARGSCRSFA